VPDDAAIRAGLATALGVITDVQISPYALSQPTPPLIQIVPGEMIPLAMAQGFDRCAYTIQAMVAFTADIGSQVLMDQFRADTGAKSIRQALWNDSTLGGVVDKVSLTRIGPYSTLAREGGGLAIVVEFSVDIYA
jgi:hypothetical protein